MRKLMSSVSSEARLTGVMRVLLNVYTQLAQANLIASHVHSYFCGAEPNDELQLPLAPSSISDGAPTALPPSHLGVFRIQAPSAARR